MLRFLRTVLFCGALLLLAAPAARAQAPDWRPPSRQMPQMPQRADLTGDWLSPRSGWFRGVEGVSGVATSALRASGEPRAGSDVLQVARFMNGPIPAVIWSDRNSDGRADTIEILRSGGIIIQLIDADFDGSANVLRVYDSAGKLLRETPM